MHSSSFLVCETTASSMSFKPFFVRETRVARLLGQAIFLCSLLFPSGWSWHRKKVKFLARVELDSIGRVVPIYEVKPTRILPVLIPIWLNLTPLHLLPEALLVPNAQILPYHGEKARVSFTPLFDDFFHWIHNRNL